MQVRFAVSRSSRDWLEEKIWIPGPGAHATERSFYSSDAYLSTDVLGAVMRRISGICAGVCS